MVPLAIGNDGLGSIRIPAACCGLFGIKPGYGTVPAQLGTNDWYGFAENGPLATTVEDAALALGVMAAQPAITNATAPNRPLRIALSTRAPAMGIDLAAAEPRTRMHVRMGRWAQRFGMVGPAKRQWWRARLERFFARYDVLLTPTLASPPLAAIEWRHKSWLSNIVANSRYAPFAALWNLAGFPAASIPAGMHSCGLPLAVQLVGRPGSESILLAVARQIEAARPWPRNATRASNKPNPAERSPN
jgi:amidase